MIYRPSFGVFYQHYILAELPDLIDGILKSVAAAVAVTPVAESMARAMRALG